MKRKERDGNEEKRSGLCRRRNPIAVDLKSARVTRCTTHQEVLPQSMKRKEEEEEEESKFDSLPYDLKMGIVSRLDAKSVIKFRCVSKFWSSIIRSRGFIHSFFSMSSKQSRRFIVALGNGLCNEPEEKLTFFLSFQESSSSSSLVPNLEMAIPVGLSSISDSFASLHGFLTLDVHGGLMVCNPSTEQVIKLHTSTRFVGYDPIEGLHKALSVESIGRHRSDHLEHKVCTLGGGGGEWRHIEAPLGGPYRPNGVGICVNGVIYYPARNSADNFRNPVMVCFDVRTEKLSFIQAHNPLLQWGKYSAFIDYNGKLASIVRYPYNRFNSFDLWILQDPEKHEWSMQHCVFPSSVWDSVWGFELSFPGTNEAGEIIMAPTTLSPKIQPFYIFYYNVKTQNVRRVRLLGIGDYKEFRRSYGFLKQRFCLVRIAPQHVPSIASL